MIHIEDQHCEKGIFKQTVFASSTTCDGKDKQEQEYSVDSCHYGYKLAEPCGHDTMCLDSQGAKVLGAILVSLVLLSFLLIQLCCCK